MVSILQCTFQSWWYPPLVFHLMSRDKRIDRGTMLKALKIEISERYPSLMPEAAACCRGINSMRLSDR